mmetsp:Transcript_26227/g.77565  ORF Transcript_26227/g.77565 Transcript_26227/m.77565 type:complete len:254 (-) Transcript_26227:302-1063(-)
MTLWWWQRQGSILLDFCSHLCQSACQPNRTLNGHYLLFRSFQLRVVLVAYELRGCGHFNMWAKRICSMRFAATGLLRKILWQNFPLLRKDSLRGAIGNLCHHSFSCIIACYTICLVFARGKYPALQPHSLFRVNQSHETARFYPVFQSKCRPLLPSALFQSLEFGPDFLGHFLATLEVPELPIPHALVDHVRFSGEENGAPFPLLAEADNHIVMHSTTRRAVDAPKADVPHRDIVAEARTLRSGAEIEGGGDE